MARIEVSRAALGAIWVLGLLVSLAPPVLAGGGDRAKGPPIGFTGSDSELFSGKPRLGAFVYAGARGDDGKPSAPLELRGLDTRYYGDLMPSPRLRYRFPALGGDANAPAGDTALWASEMAEKELSVAERVRRNLKDMAPDERLRALGLTPEDVEAWDEWSRRESARRSARAWLGDEGFDEVRKEFGSRNDNAAARDASGWDRTYLYCGGACVAAGS